MKLHFAITFFLLLIAITGCQKENEDPTPDANYTGTLTLEYSRTFPELTASVPIDVQVYKSGDVSITDPAQEAYSGEDIMELGGGARVKLNETGTITITSLNGEWKVIGDQEYLSVNSNTLIDGTQNIWGWDDDYGWILVGDNLPFSVEDPIVPPLNFLISEAMLSGAVLGVTQNTQYGSLVYKWTLRLTPEIVP